jgi:hypothetical protein
VITTDYSAGIAHIPGYKHEMRPTIDYVDGIKRSCESGKTAFVGSVLLGGKPIPAPSLEDVLYSLVLDAGAIDASSFEEWANEYGFDTDSRQAETTYKACLEIGLKLRAMIGDDNLEKLRVAFQDY